MKLRSLTITETPDGWKVDGGRTYRSAVAASKAIKRQDKKAAEKAGAAVTIITWMPTTKVGRIVAAALCGK